MSGVALALLLCGCTGHHAVDTLAPVASASPGSIAWVDRPAPVYTPPPDPTPSAQYADCTAGQLAAHDPGGGPAAGTYYDSIRLTNIGQVPCTLAGAPASVLGVRSGQRTTLARGSDGDSNFGPGPVNLEPGEHGFVTLATADGCQAAIAGQRDDYSSLVLVLADGGEVPVDLAPPLNLVCGLLVSNFGAPYRFPADSSPLDALTAHVQPLDTVTAGTTLHYTVALSNESTHDVTFSPCPSYTQTLFVIQSSPADRTPTMSTYFLNCDALPGLPAGASATLEMQIAVPESTGEAKFSWVLNGTDVASGTAVDVVAPSSP